MSRKKQITLKHLNQLTASAYRVGDQYEPTITEWLDYLKPIADDCELADSFVSGKPTKGPPPTIPITANTAIQPLFDLAELKMFEARERFLRWFARNFALAVEKGDASFLRSLARHVESYADPADRLRAFLARWIYWERALYLDNLRGWIPTTYPLKDVHQMVENELGWKVNKDQLRRTCKELRIPLRDGRRRVC